MTSTDLSWLDRGRQHLQRGNAAAALECFAQAVAADTQSAEAWNAYGVALRQLNRIQEALRANEQALRLDPALPKAWYNKGLLLELNLNQPDAALKCYER
ncbi:tetratricopeptide repeat protein, partial [Thermoleptolyngbya sp.]